MRSSLPNGKSVFHQPDELIPNGYLLPFHLDTQNDQRPENPLHQPRLGRQHEAWNGGKMDNWLPAHRKADGAKAHM